MLLSVIIPVYNAERYLAEAIDSALRAGFRVGGEWELILVDNNSTDGSPAILRSYAGRYKDCIRVLQAHNQGAPAARNAGLSVASGEWIQFLDADDYLEDDKIDAQLTGLSPDCEWVIGAYYNQWPDGTTDVEVPHEDPFKGLVCNHLVGNTNANLYRRATLARIGNWNEKTPAYDDPHLHLRLLKNGAVYQIDPVPRSYYRHHGGEFRVTNGSKAPQSQQAVDLIAEAISYLRESRPSYYYAHAPFFNGALLRAIRILATYDLDAATSAYAAYFAPPNEGAIDRPYELVGRYTRLYPYLGFRNLERLRLALAAVLPESLKRRLKA